MTISINYINTKFENKQKTKQTESHNFVLTNSKSNKKKSYCNSLNGFLAFL